MSELVETALLGCEVRRQRINGRRLEAAVHAFMAAVLPRLAWSDALRTNTESDPPLGQGADATDSKRGKRRAVIRADAIGQAVFPKRPFHPRLHRLSRRMREPLACKQITREVVAQRKRIATMPVAQREIAFEVDAPELITVLTGRKRRAVRMNPAAHSPRPDQACAFEYLTGGAVGRPSAAWILIAQTIEYLLGSKALMCKLHLNNHLNEFGRRRIRVSMRRARVLGHRLHPLCYRSLDPLVSRRTTDPIRRAQLRLLEPSAQPIVHKALSFIHRTGLRPRHWQALLCQHTVGCKPC